MLVGVKDREGLGLGYPEGGVVAQQAGDIEAELFALPIQGPEPVASLQFGGPWIGRVDGSERLVFQAEAGEFQRAGPLLQVALADEECLELCGALAALQLEGPSSADLLEQGGVVVHTQAKDAGHVDGGSDTKVEVIAAKVAEVGELP